MLSAYLRRFSRGWIMFRHSFIKLALFSCLAVLMVLPAASGAKPNKDDAPLPVLELPGPEAIDPSFAGFHFGMSKEDTELFVKGRVEKYYADLMAKTRDVRKSDDLLQEKNARLATVATDWITFDGSHTGWAVSIIRWEFKNGFGEEALHVQDGYEHFYYFFANGQLYKLVRTWDSARFPSVREKLIQTYGKAAFKVKPGDYDRRFLSDLRWHGNNLTVDVEDWTDQFKSVTVRWADTVADAFVMRAWGDLDSGLPKLNPLIDAAKQEDKNRKTDPVDDLLGR